MRACLVLAMVLTVTPSRADSFLTSVGGDDSDLADNERTLEHLLVDKDAFHHKSIVGNYLGTIPQAGLAGYLHERLRRAPDDRWRKLDYAIVVTHNASYTKDRKLTRIASDVLHDIIADDSQLLLVIATLLAQIEWIDTGGAASSATAGKRDVVSILERGCLVNRAKPQRGFVAALQSFVSYAGLQPAYGKIIANRLDDCGTDPKPPPKNGSVFERYPNGKTKAEYQYVNDQLDGITRKWDDDGNLVSESHYRNNRQEGTEKRWYRNGRLQSTTEYRGGFRTGRAVFYAHDGKKTAEGDFQNGRAEGVHTTWFPNGAKQRETTYVDNKKHGLETTYYDNGKKREQGHYTNDVRTGEWTAWERDGSVIRR